uniref:Kinetochore protein Nuf2 N-terminal domain-containing protein n=1 Tax=Graphocephala atropunctata TaxID=36148 RepID=A0A1B6L419_9HEMI
MNKSSEQQLLDDIKKYFPNFKCTLQDLRNPTEEFVTNFYSCWLQEFEVDIVNVSQIQFSQMSIVGSYQDAYSGAIPRINLLRSIRAFDVVQDFGMLDIISPTPKRTQANLRAIIEFYNWSDFCVCSLIDKKKDLNDRQKNLKSMMKEREDLKEKLNTTIKTIAQIQDVKKQLEDEILSLQKRASELNPEKQMLKSKTDETTEKLKEKESTLLKINKEELQISNKMKEMANLVVDSPTTVISDLESLRTKHAEIKELSERKRDMVETRMQNQSKVNKDYEDQQLRAEQLNELVKLIDQQRELLKVVQTTDKDMAAAQELLRDLKATLLALGNKRANRQEKLQSSYLRWMTQKPQLMESVEAAIRELNKKNNEKKKINDSLKEDSAVQEKIDSLLHKIKTHIEDFQGDCDALTKQGDDYLKILEENANAHMESVRKEVKERYIL